MNSGIHEAVTGLALFAAFFGVCFLIFGLFRYYQVFVCPKKILKKRKKTIDKRQRRVYNDNRR